MRSPYRYGAAPMRSVERSLKRRIPSDFAECSGTRLCHATRMRPAINAILQRLLELDSSELSLDIIGDAIGVAAISAEEIDELFHALESAGRQIGTATPNIRQHLNLVLREARRLRNAQNATPDAEAIASASGLTPGEVRAALLYASVLGQGKG